MAEWQAQLDTAADAGRDSTSGNMAGGRGSAASTRPHTTTYPTPAVSTLPRTPLHTAKHDEYT